MPGNERQQNLARGRIDRIGAIHWGIHDTEEIVERVLADYAMIGKTPIVELAKRAKQRVMENASES